MDGYLTQIFIHVINSGYQAGIAVIAIMLARIFLSVLRVPKKYICFLWLIPFMRLTLPILPQSAFSLLPEQTEPVPVTITAMERPEIAGDFEFVNQMVNQLLPAASPAASVNPMQVWMFVFAAAWAAGAFLLFLYGVISSIYLKRKLCISICGHDPVYLADGIPTAFVMGIFRPRIYIPSDIPEDVREYVVCHEMQHMKRKDHIAKIIIFVFLCLYWFHPLIWAAYFLAGRDIEFACDEAVIQSKSESYRQEYAAALLSLSTGTRRSVMVPIAFSEGSPKKRIQHIISYKQPQVLMTVVGAAAVLLLAAGLLTNPVAKAGSKTDTDKAGSGGLGTFTSRRLSFPASKYGLTEYNAKIFEIDPFFVSIDLPAEWELAIPQEYTGSGGPGGFSPVFIASGGENIGTIDFCTFDPPNVHENEKPENYYRMVYSQIMLGSVVTWDCDYTPVKKGEHFESATCRIAVRDTAPEDYRFGILAYDSTLGVYITIYFVNAALDGSSLNEIAKSISFAGE